MALPFRSWTVVSVALWRCIAKDEGRSISVSVHSAGYLRPKVCFVLCTACMCVCKLSHLPFYGEPCPYPRPCVCCARNSDDLAAAVPCNIPLPYCFVKSSEQLAETNGLRSGAKRKGFRCWSRCYHKTLSEISGQLQDNRPTHLLTAAKVYNWQSLDPLKYVIESRSIPFLLIILKLDN